MAAANRPESPDHGPRIINQMSTHLPDQVVYANHTKEHPFQSRFQGVLMFLDISGFTALCEKYSMNARNGTDQLTKTLNGYMEAIVTEVIKMDGDILKFAGDAILTLWKVDNFPMMKSTVRHVIKCALNIQEHCGEWTTSVGVKLRVKIGVSAGEVSITYLGNSEFCHYVTLGRAVEAVNLAEKFCKSGDIIISPSAWVYCVGLTTEHTVMEDNKHIKITELTECPDTYNMVRTQAITGSMENLVSKRTSMTSEDHILDSNKSETTTHLSPSTDTTSRPHSSQYGDSKKRRNSFRIKFRQNQVRGFRKHSKHARTETTAAVDTSNATRSIGPVNRVRNAVLEQLSAVAHHKLRLYCPLPVLRNMEMKQPLEYLSEMRQVTIVFINLTLDECTSLELCLTLQTAFDVVYVNVKKGQGCMNKIFMFDKGSTFLVVFGLPGFKHENDCAHALRCAARIKTELDDVAKISAASIGVTTGPTFVGVVGHPHRHEYTVIGRKVNMAARLMMYYGDKVTCDKETFHHSKMNRGHFVSLEAKELKGLQNVGVIREYQPAVAVTREDPLLYYEEQENAHPIIGREREQNLLLEVLDSVNRSASAAAQRQCIFFQGEPGIGKSRMLDWCAATALRRGIRVISCTLSMQDAKTPLYAVKTLLMDLLELDLEMNHHERENTIFAKLKDPFTVENMSLLNEVLHIKLDSDNEPSTNSERTNLLRKLLLGIVREICRQGFVIFSIDDGHYMDPQSWEFVHVLGTDMKSLVIASLRMPFVMCDTATTILAANTTLHISLLGLSSTYVASLACQFLGVHSVPDDLEKYLCIKSHGVPSWCEQLLRHMFYEGIIRIENKFDKSSKKNLGQYNTLSQSDEGSATVTQEDTPKFLVCKIATGKTLDGSLPDSIKGMIQARIDRMEEIDQLVIKTASILGMTFPKQILDAVLPVDSDGLERLPESVQRLADSGVFQCATRSFMGTHTSGTIMRTGMFSGQEKGVGMNHVTCLCPNINGQVHDKPMRECQFIGFQATTTQETAYGMFLEESRRDLHIKAARFLESKPHKCHACGGDDFMSSCLLFVHQGSSSDRESVETPTQSDSHQPARRASQSLTRSSNRRTMGIGVVQKVDRKFRRESRVLDLFADDLEIIPSGDSSMANHSSMIASSKRKDSGYSKKTRFANTFDRTKMAISEEDEEEEQKVNITNETMSMETTMQLDVDQILKAMEEHESVPEKSTTEVDPLKPTAIYTVDLRECECMKILSSVYPQLVRHWRAAGNIERTAHFLMEAAAAVSAIDNMQAVSYLEEVQRIIIAVKDDLNPFEGEVTHTMPYTFGKWEEARLENFIGQAYFQRGQLEESIPHFEKSLLQYNVSLPRTKIKVFFELGKVFFTQWKLNHFPRRYVGSVDAVSAHELTEQAQCLAHLMHWHLVSRKDYHALLVALMEVNRAEQADTDLHELIMAYTNMMEICHIFNWPIRGQQYELKAQVRCFSALQTISSDNLVTVAHLYYSLLNMRLAWGKIEEAIEAGYSANRLIERVHDNDMRIQMLPVLVQSLLLANRIMDAVDLLKELEFIQAESTDLTARVWYYALCMDLILEGGAHKVTGGFQLEHATKALEFKQQHMEKAMLHCPQESLFYFNTCALLWDERRGCRDQFNWHLPELDTCRPRTIDNFLTGRSFIKVLEIKLLQLSSILRVAGKKNNFMISMAHTDIKKDVKILSEASVRLPALKPRLLHMEAYHAMLSKNAKRAKKLVSKCLTICNKQGNRLDYLFAENCLKEWFGDGTDLEHSNLWLQHSTSCMPDYHASLKPNASTMKFTLPVPSLH